MARVKTILIGALGRLAERAGIRSVALEVIQDCNQRCAFCYNVWKCGDYPHGQLDTPRTIDLIDRIIRGYHPHVLSFTGGEPLMRSDLPELIRHAAKKTNCNLITNGTLMTDDLAREFVGIGVRVFEFTLLSADRDVHNSLVGRESFDELIEGIAAVRAAGGVVTTTFVAMKSNIASWEETLELNIALGVSGILFNRFNFGGAGVGDGASLTPSARALRNALEIAEEGAGRFGVSISCGVPAPPCIIDRSKFKHVHFSDCPMGTRRAYPTVDALGNVRPCNHSPTVLGNLFESDFAAIMSSEKSRGLAKNVATDCLGCKDVKTCRGGCRAAAEVCGDAWGVDPSVGLCQGEEVEPCLRTC
jgi:radical SAM protein with 4Fe4S-binding SPASM domain